jgi:hypothetical protein
MVRHITITNRKKEEYTVLVDDEDYEDVSSFTWFIWIDRKGHKYAGRGVRQPSGRYKTVFMHAYINKTPNGSVTDHINGNGLDNRKENLRTCTRPQNAWNTHTVRTNTSGYRNVCWAKSHNMWKVAIRCNGTRKFVGYFPSIEDAAVAEKNARTSMHSGYSPDLAN